MNTGLKLRRTSLGAVLCLAVSILAALAGAVALFLHALAAMQVAQGLELPAGVPLAARIVGGSAAGLAVVGLILAFGARVAVSENSGTLAGRGILQGALLMALAAILSAAAVF